MTAKPQPAKHLPNVFGVADAKAHFSELVELAQTQGPQQINRHGRPAAVLVSVEEWERRTKPKGTLLDFFRSSPLYGSDIELERSQDLLRDVEF